MKSHNDSHSVTFMLDRHYFETMHRLHEVKTFRELSEILVQEVPRILGTGEAVILEMDSLKVVRAVYGSGRFAGGLQKRIDVLDDLCQRHPASEELDVRDLGYEAVAASDFMTTEAYRCCGWVNAVFPGLNPSDCMLGQMISSGYRHGILLVYRCDGSFQDPEVRERFNAVLLSVRGILERISGHDAEDKFLHKVLNLKTRHGLPIFIINKNGEVIPLSHAAVSHSERHWDRDEPMWILSAEARANLERVAIECWENPVEARWGTVELNLGRGPEPMEVLPKLKGDATLVIPPSRSEESGETNILTERQREIMGWIAEGKTSAEAGIILGISPRTVEKHLEAIFQRMGVENRIAAVRAYLEMNSRHPAGS